MRLPYFCALYLAVVLPGFAQTTTNAGPGLPKDPRDILAAAAPFYDFTSPEMKPWHLKATYQLYDNEGKPGEQGTYEYWWASPQVYRSTWTRPGATHTDWHTVDGNIAHQKSGEQLAFFEEGLRDDFISPLTPAATLDPTKIRLDRETISFGKAKAPCIKVTPQAEKHVKIQPASLGTFCFDPNLPALRLTYTSDTMSTEFDHVVKVQNKYLAREIHVYYGKREVLSASVEAIAPVAPSDPAFTPSPDATIVKLGKIHIGSEVMAGMLIKKLTPIYPQSAKDSGISGVVIVQATIGRDGKIHDLHVILSPSPLLSDSAKEAVSHWEYEPYLLNDEPVEVETTINVIYTLGR